MKVNTDGVLLAVLAETDSSSQILDIGTGTGVIALILAQRFLLAKITAVEIEENAAIAAAGNFSNSVFNSRLQVIHSSIERFFENNRANKFDLIVSNPPFFIDSLIPDKPLKGVARHTNQAFFESLLCNSALHLEESGELTLILPVKVSELVQSLALKHKLYVQRKISISSFADSIPHREIVSLGFISRQPDESKFIIYNKPKEYSTEYQKLLKDFFTIF